MLSIRKARQARFDAEVAERFEQGLCTHVQKVYSAQCLKLGEEPGSD